MKIMQVLPYFCFGGAETMCKNLCLGLRDLGHTVVAVCLYDRPTPISRQLEQAEIPVRFLDKKLGLDVSMVNKLTKLMKLEQPDVVHTHLDVIKYAALAAKLAGVARCVHTVHSVAQKEAEGKAQKIINGFYYRHGWSVPVGLSALVCQSIGEFYGLPPEKIPLVPNGIDLSRYTPKTDYRLGNPVRLVHVGRFDVPKNHKGMLEMFAKLHGQRPACRLVLVGDGDLFPQVQAQAQALGIAGSVDFCGMQGDVRPYLAQADVFWLPSLYEGNPMTIIEAMASGLPIVASAVGGIPDMVTDDVSALLRPCETEPMLEAINGLLDDEALRRRLGQKALAESGRFSQQTMAQGYCRVYAGHCE